MTSAGESGQDDQSVFRISPGSAARVGRAVEYSTRQYKAYPRPLAGRHVFRAALFGARGGRRGCSRQRMRTRVPLGGTGVAIRISHYRLSFTLPSVAYSNSHGRSLI